jgi:glycosyltransferase involved in cell wall biosynthesis
VKGVTVEETSARGLPHIGRVPIPLGTAGSSILTGICQQTAVHRRRGGSTSIVVAHNRDVQVPHATNIAVDYTRYCPKEWFSRKEMLIDAVAGRFGCLRAHSGQMFVPAIRALREAQPDVVLLHEGHHATSSLPYWRTHWPEARIVLYVHTPLSRSYGPRELRRLLGLADGCIFVSGHARRQAERRVGRLPIPSAVVHNGVDHEIFHPRGRPQASGPLRITFAGEVSPHKGPHLLLEAVARMHDAPSVSIIGGSRHRVGLELTDYARSLRSAASSHGTDARFVDYLSPDRLAGEFRDSDVVVVPSVWDEPFGRVAIEAMACGAAVVTSDRGGLPEATNGAAITVDPRDSDRLARTLDDLADEEYRSEWQERGIARATDLTWERSYEKMLGVLETLN